MINKIKNILVSFVYLIYVQIIFFFQRKAKGPYCTVLAYHSVPDSQALRFKQQMKILKRFSIPIPLNYDGPFVNGSRYTIVTFDDAFRNVIKNALPEMTRSKIPFTLFIPAGNLGANPKWLENTGDSDALETVSSVEQLSKLPVEIVTFGSHTVSHPDLTGVDHDKAYFEIRKSKDILEKQLNRKMDYFAFPHGSYNSRLIDFCRQAGYKQVFSITPESPLEPLRKYVKGRVLVSPSNKKIAFTLKILGGYGWKAHSKSLADILQGSS